MWKYFLFAASAAAFQISDSMALILDDFECDEILINSLSSVFFSGCSHKALQGGEPQAH